jgi:hypothetical protein
VCGGGAGGDEIGAHAIHLERRADPGDGDQLFVAQHDRGQQPAGGHDPLPQGLLRGGVGLRELLRVSVEGHPAPDHLGPQLRVARGGDLHGEPEPVEQLRAELALLGIHGADQHDPGCVADRHPLALDRGPAGRRGVQQQVD